MAKEPGIVDSNRIRAVRRSKNMTMEQLAERVGVHFTTIGKFERSTRGVSGEMLAKIAAGLGVSPAELVDEMPGSLPIRMVPLLGKIAAGNWKEAVLDPQGFIPAPVGGANAFALIPDGNSMNMIVGENAMIIVDPDEVELREGKVYAVMNGDGETTFKRFRTDPVRLEPVSSDPAHTPILVGREPFTVIGRVVAQMSQL
ncbi:MAG: hypothetical protein JWQ03_3078 [Variovorax sp.]|nr:hypothetical protein [Variovorax sp.]